MNINNDLSVNRQVMQQVTADTKVKADAVDTKEVKVEAKATDATISSNKVRSEKELNEIINENILSASSSYMDISKAADMIKAANMNILKNSGDAVMTQSKQSASMAMELLK